MKARKIDYNHKYYVSVQLLSDRGMEILRALAVDHPVARMIVDSAAAHYRVTGDGVVSFIMMMRSVFRCLEEAGLLLFALEFIHHQSMKYRVLHFSINEKSSFYRPLSPSSIPLAVQTISAIIVCLTRFFYNYFITRAWTLRSRNSH